MEMSNRTDVQEKALGTKTRAVDTQYGSSSTPLAFIS